MTRHSEPLGWMRNRRRPWESRWKTRTVISSTTIGAQAAQVAFGDAALRGTKWKRDERLPESNMLASSDLAFRVESSILAPKMGSQLN